MPSDIYPTYILIRVNEFDRSPVTPLEEWLRYLRYGVVRLDTMVPGLKEACGTLQYYSMSKEERHAYDEHLNAVMIQNDVLSTAKMEGYEEGRMESLRERARKFKEFDVSVETIAKATGVSVDVIEKL
ncbi:hypothetical protein M3090_12315 [Bacteroides sp. ET71]|uniref:hypothetical protein n=1 Tax=Bacteroides sp. ET71 TaxID=2939421 RepID=UPI0020125960|nr:hypothetical protein [Bacteroides sp. ET71]MCL1617172.1 hypothetical protein [Bacteroides sp. ET71]